MSEKRRGWTFSLSPSIALANLLNHYSYRYISVSSFRMLGCIVRNVLPVTLKFKNAFACCTSEKHRLGHCFVAVTGDEWKPGATSPARIGYLESVRGVADCRVLAVTLEGELQGDGKAVPSPCVDEKCSANRTHVTRVADFFELAGVDVVDETTDADRIRTVGGNPGVVEYVGHRTAHVPAQPFHVGVVTR